MRYLQALLLVSVLFVASCKKDTTDPTPEINPGRVSISIKDPVTIAQVFEFINEQHLDVITMGGFNYDIPGMTQDSLASVNAYFASKEYADNPETEDVEHIYARYDSVNNMIFITPGFYQMSNTTFQQDFLTTIAQLGLVDKNDIFKGLTVRVPDGQEYYWANEFMKFEIVQHASVDAIMRSY